VVPTGMPLRGLEMSVDMRLGAVSEETAGSDGSDPLAVGLSGPLDFAGRQVRLLQPHMSPRPRRTRVAGRRRRLVCPWLYRRRGQRCGSIAGCWAPCCGFRRVARAGQLVRLAFPRIVRWSPVGSSGSASKGAAAHSRYSRPLLLSHVGHCIPQPLKEGRGGL